VTADSVRGQGSSAIAATLSCLSDSVNYDPAEILAAQEHFGFARPTAIEKDWHILRAMGAIASTDTAPFSLLWQRRGRDNVRRAAPKPSRRV
jgi:hypothetical protein